VKRVLIGLVWTLTRHVLGKLAAEPLSVRILCGTKSSPPRGIILTVRMTTGARSSLVIYVRPVGPDAERLRFMDRLPYSYVEYALTPQGELATEGALARRSGEKARSVIVGPDDDDDMDTVSL
jgi:hypothetical protein